MLAGVASVHRRLGSKYFHAAWRDATGRLHLRSTKQTERAKALTVALEYERAEKLASSSNLTETQAREVLTDILKRTNSGEVLRNPPARQWLLEWLAAKESLKAESTGIRYRLVIEGFVKHLGLAAQRPLISVTARQIQAFLDTRAKDGCSPSTVQVEGKVLRAAFNRARREGVISTNPAEAVDLPRRQTVERGTFTSQEVSMMVEHAKGEWKTLITLGYYTGARLSECCAVKWGDIDFAKGTLTFGRTKAGRSHTIPLHPALQDHLEQVAGDLTGYVLPKLASVQTSGRRGLSESFKRIMVQAGLDYEQVQGAGKRRVSRRSFHALRHSFASSLANAGVAQDVRMTLTGHRSTEVHRGYTHYELLRLKDAIGLLPRLVDTGNDQATVNDPR